MGAEDLHLEASLDAIRQATGIQTPRSVECGAWSENTPAYDLLGRRINISPSSLLPPHSSKKTIIISNGKKYLSK
jgi:hypothetical protein